MDTTELRIDTGGRHVLDLTDRAAAFAAEAGGDGLLQVFVPHATAGLAVMETGSGSEEDLEEVLARLLPRDDRWSHRHGSRGHGADHLLPVFAGPSLTVPVQAGRLLLAPGSASASSTSTTTTLVGGSASASCAAEPLDHLDLVTGPGNAGTPHGARSRMRPASPRSHFPVRKGPPS